MMKSNPQNTTPIRAGAYIRVSTTEQAETGTSLTMQRNQILAQIAAKGWTLHDIYEDAGHSGGSLNRPALQRLLADINTDTIQAVVIYKLDRLSRKQRDTLYLLEDVFLTKDVALVSITESLDTSTPTGRAMIGMLSLFAQLERDTITERLSGGRRQIAQRGRYAGGGVPIGYTTVRGAKALTIDETKAAAVQLVFKLSAKHLKLQEIADQLNNAGYTTKNGAKFTPTQVWRIIQHRKMYSGTYTYGGISATGQHPNIIQKH